MKNVKGLDIACNRGSEVDYSIYHCSILEKAGCICGCLAASGILAWLIYRSVWGMVLSVPMYFFFRREYERQRKRQRKKRLLQEFKDGIQAVSASLLAGYSMENAWREAEKELKELRGEDSMMYREVVQINAAVRMNRPLERVLQEFADRSGCEEIESFAEVFSFAKRSGGDFAGMIQVTVRKLAERIEVEKEIATILAGKRLEGRIMDLMPLLILAYLNISSEDFLAPLYGNAFGGIVMSGALGAYVAAIKWSEHILNIKV